MGDAPTLFELMDQFKTPEVMRGVARVIMASGDFGRPMVAGPGNPPERIKILRDAYAKAMRDPELIAETKKSKMDMEHTPGEDLQALLKEIMNQPPDVIERVKKVLTE
jgi:tripartite-type tricarboxylate transporter receptor subunit TctC